MTKQAKQYIKENIPYYGKIPTKGRYAGVKAKSWSILSDYTRCRDFILYGTFVDSGEKVRHWRDGDAGHYISMAGHGVYSGFSDKNIHLQSKSGNGWGGQDVGYAFGKELERRYGKKFLLELKKDVQVYAKDDDWFHIEKIKEIYNKFQKLKKKYPNYEYPQYV